MSAGETVFFSAFFIIEGGSYERKIYKICQADTSWQGLFK